MSIPTDRLREIADGAMGIGAPLVLTQAEQVEVCTELLALRDATSLPGYTRLVDERDAARAEAEKLRSRLRETNQTIVECIGASGPDTSEDAAKRAVDEIEKLRGILDDTESESGLAALQVDEAVEEYPTLPDFVKHIVEERVAYGEEADALSREVESLRAQLAAVTTQRDELLRAAEPCCVPFYGGVYHDALRFTVESVRSAIRNEKVDALDRELAIARAQPEQPQQPKEEP